jgi:hypothetical protein
VSYQFTTLKKIVRFKRAFRKFGFAVVSMFLLFTTLGVFGQDAVNWIRSYSSIEFDENHQPEKASIQKIYYFWQLESLKRAISPRYIKILDIQSYKLTNRLLNKGILFTYYGLRNNEVSVCGNFSVWKCIPMQKNKFGVFFTLVPVEFNRRNGNMETSYKYKFKVDDIFEYDPVNSNRYDDNLGSFVSEFTLEKVDIDKQISYKVQDKNLEEEAEFKTVEFRIYKPEANTISIVGSFNHWNPEHDYMIKDNTGTFVLKKKMKPGEYLYNFIIDGKKELDTYNEQTRYREETGEVSSYMKIEDGGVISL